MLKLYNHQLSGNCHKVRLMLSLLGLEYEIVPVNVLGGEHKSPQFLKLNPFGLIPVLVDGDVIIRDSQAILVYLAKAYGGEDWLPGKAESMSKIVQWLSIAANEIQNSLAALRLHFLFNAQIDLELAQQKARQLLQVMDAQLAQRQWLEMNRPTIADVACYPYIKLAADARVSLEPYPQVIKWLDRIEQLPGYVSLV